LEDPSLWALPRDVLDPCPLILKADGTDRRPMPFRFTNHWLKNKNFKVVVKELWESQGVGGWMRVLLRNKLKKLKGALESGIRWNMGVWRLGWLA
jgi:hypothetical protein